AVLHAGGEIGLGGFAQRDVAVEVDGAVVDLGVADAARAALGLGAVGSAAVEPFAGGRQATAHRELDAAVGRCQGVLAVAARVLAPAEHRLAAGPALQRDVDHSGDGVGAVLRGGAVAQHFDPVDRQD